MIIGESALYAAISVLLSVLLIFSLKGLCEYMVGVTPEVMFATPYMWLVQAPCHRAPAFADRSGACGGIYAHGYCGGIEDEGKP